MKTFTTSGTGSQQTLSPIETDKIPVYDSVTDAESDLANLAENQIIATHDTGSELSAPVDTVQSGNMHSVTSNAVAKSLSYSTTEQKTGGVWIDGKPIYRKVVEVSSMSASASSQTIPHNISNLGKLIRFYGTVTISNRTRTFPYFDKDNECNIIYYDNTNLTVYLGYPISDLKLVIEYTKTTD